jgi:hypothetical protein
MVERQGLLVEAFSSGGKTSPLYIIVAARENLYIFKGGSGRLFPPLSDERLRCIKTF